MSAKIFIKHVTTLVSGTLLAQAIAFCFSIVLARVYDDANFGYFSAFLGVLSILSIIATGSYDKALMFSHTSRRSFSLILLVLLIAAVMSLTVAFGGVVLAALSIKLPLGFSSFESVILLPCAIMLMASSQLLTFVALKAGHTQQIAWLKVAQVTLTGCVQFGGGLIEFRSIVIGYVTGLMVYIPSLFRIISGFNALHLRRMRRAILASASRYHHYPRYVCSNELIDVASNQIPLLLIGILFSVATLGQYGFAQRILAAPAALLGQAVSQVFFKSISDQAITSYQMQRLMVRVWVIMGLIGLIPFGLLFLTGESIFIWVFGSGWSEAGRMAEVLSVLLFFRFVSSPTSTIYYKLGLQRKQLIYAVLALIVRVTPILFVGLGYSIFEILGLQVIGEIFVIILFNLTAVINLRNRIVYRN